MKLVDLDTKITALLWDDEHEEETEREMTIGDFLDEFTVEGLFEIPLFFNGGVRAKWMRNERGNYNCSNCKSEYNAVFGFGFCPNCGADMREDHKE